MEEEDTRAHAQKGSWEKIARQVIVKDDDNTISRVLRLRFVITICTNMCTRTLEEDTYVCSLRI